MKKFINNKDFLMVVMILTGLVCICATIGLIIGFFEGSPLLGQTIIFSAMISFATGYRHISLTTVE